MNLLRIQKKRSDHKKLNEEINDTAMDHIMAGVEEILGQHGDFYLRVSLMCKGYCWRLVGKMNKVQGYLYRAGRMVKVHEFRIHVP